jgi:hypothetical protein
MNAYGIRLGKKVVESDWIQFGVIHQEKKKKPVNKNQGWKPIHQKYKANENISKHKPKKNTKANNQQKLSKDRMQRGLMVTK